MRRNRIAQERAESVPAESVHPISGFATTQAIASGEPATLATSPRETQGG